AALKILQLGLEPLQKRESIGRGACETNQHLAIGQLAYFMGIAFHHNVAQRHLAVAADRHAVLVPHGQNGRGVHFVHGLTSLPHLNVAPAKRGDKVKVQTSLQSDFEFPETPDRQGPDLPGHFAKSSNWRSAQKERMSSTCPP